ncbi:MAG: CgeB family protein, partial [Candidatus Limnocylindrales bacterium]
AERCAAYDLVFVASEPFVEHLRRQVEVPVLALHQATDPELFHPEPGGAGPELLFVGNSRNRHRPVLDALAGTTHDLAVYGGNWRPELLDPRFLRGDWIANDAVHRAYAAAAIVLNDHWPDMRDEGFISNRIYDVLASGGFVLSDPVAGLDPEFDGAVPTWIDADDLRSSIERYLADPALRQALSARGRAAVLARHTFGRRAAVLRDAAGPLWAARPRLIDPDGSGPPG